ncbi:hypothetical protein [Rhodococcus indonesiensis]|uniref:DUF8017 domain-containing protein n=1 Tax=Rhodococcus indonesiensis TaxID=3055869 RepID=A0ABT7RH93_9NOCA|nr:hypothetical protein [Rhodococcus indonesiensis]MDM7487012.1 hypothetical protein [Rhodococcus indonesiensis]
MSKWGVVVFELGKVVLWCVAGALAIGGISAAGSLLAPDVPEAVPEWAPPVTTSRTESPTATTPRRELPPGFPSMERAPDLPDVPEGAPQPVPTKFGLTYTTPPGWFGGESVMGWKGRDGRMLVIGSASSLGKGYCAAEDTSTLASVGITGRSAGDLLTVAAHEVRAVESMYSGGEQSPTVEYSDPVHFDIDGNPAVRITALVSDIPPVHECAPPAARWDFVATTGLASAEVVVFVVQTDRGVAGQLDDDSIDGLVESLRRS